MATVRVGALALCGDHAPSWSSRARPIRTCEIPGCSLDAAYYARTTIGDCEWYCCADHAGAPHPDYGKHDYLSVFDARALPPSHQDIVSLARIGASLEALLEDYVA